LKTIVNVNRHIISKNNKLPLEQHQPPIRVSKGKYGKPIYYNEYTIGDVTIKYDPKNPLPCGAKVWIETNK
jgi:hypothetical protein